MIDEQKTILIITSRHSKASDNSWLERQTAVESFCERLSSLLEETHVRYTTYDDLEISVSNGIQQILDTRNDLSLRDVDFVHFKNWQYDQAIAPVVAWYLLHNGIEFANTEVADQAAIGKLAQMYKLAENGLSVPMTCMVSIERLRTLVRQAKLPAGFDYPLIFKADDGAKGNDNYLVKGKVEFSKILDTVEDDGTYILQEFIPNDGDYRYLFIGLDVDPIVFLRKGTGDSHLNNTSQGGEGAFQALNGVVKKNIELAKSAARVLKKEVGGVDIILDKNTMESYVLEVNGTPALATGFGLDEKYNKVADFFAAKSQQHQEEE